MGKQFENVSCKYGAPMGRNNYGATNVEIAPSKSVRLFRVNLDSGGYDDGGAYWGHSSHSVYCAICETPGSEFFITERARNRFHAACLIGINPKQLKMPLEIPGIYQIRLEWCGHAVPKYVFRKREEWRSHHETEEAAFLACMDDYLNGEKNA